MADRRRTSGPLAIEGVPVAIVLLAIIGVFMITAPNSFQSPRIYLSFLATVPPPLIVGLGLTLVIAAGEIDLSFPSVIKMSGVVFAMLCKFVAFPLDPQATGALAPDLLIWLFGFLAVLVGAAIGFFNGVLVAVVGIPSIIATLCSLFIFEGLSLIIGNGLQFSIRGIDSYSLFHVLSGRWLGIPAQAVWGLAIAGAMWMLLNRHRFGEHLLFIGDNQDVARVLGVDVAREKIKLFTLMGALAGLASILVTLENKNFYTTQGSSYLLIVMAAVFIGGTSISGGRGSVVGTLFGCYIVGCMEAGVVASGLSGFWTRLVVGLVFLAAVIFHLAMERPGGLIGLRAGRALFARGRPSTGPAIAAGSPSGRES